MKMFMYKGRKYKWTRPAWVDKALHAGKTALLITGITICTLGMWCEYPFLNIH